MCKEVPRSWGGLFVKVMVFGTMENPKASLEGDARKCTELDPQVKIRSQGFDKRINTYAVKLLETLSKEAIKSLISTVRLDVHLLKAFTEVYLLDSTSISLPAKLSELFRASGGSASEALMKVQSLGGFLSGTYVALTPKDGISSITRKEVV
ncbi:MAG: hypothetical protein J7J76_08425 [Candidatus Latescibacteria bacterium]|nr:hypothetical protein [Candidatus Latescibacterota bacterium]